MKTEIFQALSRCYVFQGVEPKRLSVLLENAAYRTERHAAGAMVRRQGASYDRLILLASGCLEARFESTSGKSMTVEHFDAPTSVASAVLMSSEPILPVALMAEEDVFLVTIEYDTMLKLLAAEPVILKAFLENTGDTVRFLAEKMRLLRFGSLRLKIAGHLLALSAQQGTGAPRWRYGREQMADMLGVARPSLSRELSRMVGEGLIEMPDRSIVRIDVEALQSLMEEDQPRR